VRVYDTRASRKPVSSGSFGVESQKKQNNRAAASDHMNCIVALDPDTVAVATSAGDVFKVDLRTMAQVGRFKSFGGSVTSLCKHPTLPLLASASMDRFVRVHNVETRALESSTYAKQLLSCILFSPEHDAAPDKQLEAGRKRSKDQQIADEPDVIEPMIFESGIRDKDTKRKKKHAKGGKAGKLAIVRGQED
jgi:ribosome biogenesis protein NSA1